MKALIVSDDSKIINTLDDYFSKNGFNTIIYKWLLKALDNIEEIRPDVVIISSSEYPRHWKILVQFLKSGLGGNKIGIYLYENDELSEENKKKAESLGVNGYITSLETSELEKTLENINAFFDNNTVPSFEESVPTVNDIEQPISGTGHVLFTNPVTKKYVKGTYFDKSEKQITVKLDYIDDIKEISVKSNIPEFSWFNAKECKSSPCTLKEILDINGEQLVIFNIG